MRATPVSLLVAALLVAGCASNSPQADADLGPLADQADRVAQLIDEDRPCEAVEAARTLASLADDDGVSDQVNEAVTSFAASATSTIECPPASPDPTTDPPVTDAGDQDDQDDQVERDETDDKDEDDKADKGEDDRAEDPGEGKAKGKDGNPGRGNGDD